MKFLQSTSNNPYFNIATEEYLLKNYPDDFFFLYINEPSIIVGKHQNTMAEINVPYVFENNIKVVRRLSGGGTVFHDFGNLNYCFICHGKEGYLVDFKKYTQPILETLQGMQVNAYLKGKSDLVINDLKFSGNAEHVFKNRILHHGTLLFNAELSSLNKAIKADWQKFEDKAVRSNRSKVTNIKDHLKKDLPIDAFAQKILAQAESSFNQFEHFVLSPSDKLNIEKLVTEKYATWNWNFGYSPQYQFKQQVETKEGQLQVELHVEKGRIITSKLLLNGNRQKHTDLLSQQWLGKPHAYIELLEITRLFLKQANYEQLNEQMVMQLLF